MLDPQPVPAEFLETFFYREGGVLVDQITRLDPEQSLIQAVMHTTRPLPITALQRESPQHPRHVAAPELLILTGNLGALHAWFFHGCRWDQGWAGFGNRIHRADFRDLVRLGPPLELESRETRTRVGPARIVIRFEFRFLQEGSLVYRGDQSAIFVKDRPLG